MNRLLVMIFILFLFLPSVVLGNSLPKSYWLKEVSKKFPTAFCQLEPFNQLETGKCLIYIKSFTKVCIEYNEEFIPDMLKQPEDGSKWGEIMGKCVGTLFESLQGKEYY